MKTDQDLYERTHLSTLAVALRKVAALDHEAVARERESGLRDQEHLGGGGPKRQREREATHPAMTRCRTEPLYHSGIPSSLTPFAPVHRARKLAVVLGTTWSNSSKTTRPRGSPSTAKSMNGREVVLMAGRGRGRGRGREGDEGGEMKSGEDEGDWAVRDEVDELSRCAAAVALGCAGRFWLCAVLG